eukprot:scaffold1605_cov158-Amphora_coffeaeformis.AAC.7
MPRSSPEQIQCLSFPGIRTVWAKRSVVLGGGNTKDTTHTRQASNLTISLQLAASRHALAVWQFAPATCSRYVRDGSSSSFLQQKGAEQLAEYMHDTLFVCTVSALRANYKNVNSY